MQTRAKSTRQSVSLPPHLARTIKSMARSGGTSANRVIVDLIEAGLAARERERLEFLDLADRLAASTDPIEQAEIKAELARRTFGD